MDFDLLFDYLERNIYSKRSLVLFCFLFPVISSLALDILKLSLNNFYWWITVAIVDVIWVIFWIAHRNKYPKVTKGKIGVVLAIETENNLIRTKVYKDFVNHFNKLILENGLANYIQLIELNEYQSSILSNVLIKHSEYLSQFRRDGYFDKTSRPQDLEKMQGKIGGHFYIWGKIRKRLDKESKYFLDIDGLVRHIGIGVEKHKLVTNNFLEAWFKRIEFSEIFELKGFEISAELVFLVAKYIVGVAALVSHDPLLALTLHSKLKGELADILTKFNPPPQNLITISKKLDSFIAEENSLLATWYIRNGRPDLCDKYIQDSFAAKAENYSGYILKALRGFQEGNIKESFDYVMKAKKIAVNNQIWRYDLAFLYMWADDYKKGLAEYKKIAEKTFAGEVITVSEIIDFQKKLLTTNPKFAVSYFILGFLYYKKLSNLPNALENFETFMAETKKIPAFKNLREVTQSYLSEISKGMSLK